MNDYDDTLKEALDMFNKEIENDPENLAAYHNRALVHRKMRNYRKAIEDYTIVN